MEVLLILFIGAVVGGVMWNRKTSDEAMEGLRFTIDVPPQAVATVIESTYCVGAKAQTKSAVGGVHVKPAGTNTFRSESRLGDIGFIKIEAEGNGSLVHAYTDELYVGSHPSSHFRRGIPGIAAQINHGMFKLLGISPGAARMKRHAYGVEKKVRKQLAR